MINKNITTKVLLDIFAEAVSNDSDSVDVGIYWKDRGVKVIAEITFKLEDLKDDNHI